MTYSPEHCLRSRHGSARLALELFSFTIGAGIMANGWVGPEGFNSEEGTTKILAGTALAAIAQLAHMQRVAPISRRNGRQTA